MSLSRLLDLLALLALAVVLLLPKASVEARPALAGAPVELDRVARLQDDLERAPDSLDAALALGDALLGQLRADWCIATLAPFVAKERAGQAKVDGRLHLMLATARAERLESAESVAEAKLVEQACAEAEGTPRCPAGTSARLTLVRDAMQAIVERGIDPQKDPNAAKSEVMRVLHHSRARFGGQ
jgi:hypothetical protein